MILLTDDEFFEGLIGGFGWIIAIYYIRHSLKKDSNVNVAVAGLSTWAILWYIRKIGMNLYIDAKKAFGIRDRDFNLNYLGESTIWHHLFIHLFFGLLIYFIIIRYELRKTYKILKLSLRDISVLASLSFIGMLVYLT